MGNISDVDVERERLSVISGLLKTEKGRSVLREAGHTPGGSVLAAHCDERIGEVMDRVAQSRTREVVVVAYERGQMRLLHLVPGHSPDAVDAETVNRESTLGMLLDAMSAGSDGTWNLHVSAWKSAVASRPLVAAGV